MSNWFQLVTKDQANTKSSAADRWREALLSESATLREAIRCLDRSGLQIALAISDDGQLIGTLTDGDIRRALLREFEMSSPIAKILHAEPLVVPPELGRDAVMQIMQANRIHQIPIVDERRHVVGLHLMDELIPPKTRSNLMIIMAGGEGRRLRPHTENCPKPMLQVNGRPMLEHIIQRAKHDGFGHFVIAINYLGHLIEEHFGDGSELGVHIAYLREKNPLGTAGAIGLMSERPAEPFLVSNGDVLTDIRYGELLDFHCRHGATSTMAVRLHEWQHPYGVVRTNGVDIVGFDEKPVSRSHINAGIYVLDPRALDALTPGERCDMPALFSLLQSQGERTIVYPTHESWLDVGRPDDYRTANNGSSN